MVNSNSSFQINSDLIMEIDNEEIVEQNKCKRLKIAEKLSSEFNSLPVELMKKIWLMDNPQSLKEYGLIYKNSRVCKTWYKGITNLILFKELFQHSIFNLWSVQPALNKTRYDERFKYLTTISKNALQFLCRYFQKVPDLSLFFKEKDHVFFDDKDLLLLGQNFPTLKELYIGDQLGRSSCDITEEDKVPGLSDKGFKAFENLTNLRSLTLKTRCHQITHASFLSLQKCTQLTKLIFQGMADRHRFLSNCELKEVAKMTSLTELRVNVANHSEESFSQLSKLQNLRTLDLKNGSYDYWELPNLSFLYTLASLKNLTYLKFDRLRGLENLTFDETITLAKSFGGLQVLKIRDCKFTVKALTDWINASNIEIFSLKNMGFAIKKDEGEIEDERVSLHQLSRLLLPAKKLRKFSIYPNLFGLNKKEECESIIEIFKNSIFLEKLDFKYCLQENGTYFCINYQWDNQTKVSKISKKKAW